MTRVKLDLRSVLAAINLSVIGLVIWLAFVGWAAAQTQTAVEYYYAAWDYYFVTAFPDEIAVLDAGAFGGVWKRTGQTFEIWTGPADGALPTCRFFTITFAPKSSHFYTPYAAECAAVKNNPNWQFESIAFYLQLPDANGNCPPGTVILYRLYNNGMGGTPNHRFTSSLATFNQMRAQGWIFEGNQLTGAFACVPSSSPPRMTAEGLWLGSADNGSNIIGVVLDTGGYYFIYTTPGTNTIAGIERLVVNGVMDQTLVGTRSWGGVGVRDFGIGYGVFNATLFGSYIAQAVLNGSLKEGGMTVATFNLGYSATYDQPFNLVAAAGTFNGQVASSQGWQGAVITLSATGDISGSASGCSFTGRATPHGSVNVADLSVTFNGGPCIFGTSTLTGIAYYDASTRTIYGAAPNLSRPDGFLFVGNN